MSKLLKMIHFYPKNTFYYKGLVGNTNTEHDLLCQNNDKAIDGLSLTWIPAMSA